MSNDLPDGAIPAGRLGWYLPDWSDFELRLVVEGRPIVKKNNIQPIYMKAMRRASIGYTAKYKGWERDAAEQLASQWCAVFTGPLPEGIEINAAIVAYMPDRRGWPDLSAIYEGPQDVLEGHRRTCKHEGRGRCRRHSGCIVNDKWIYGHSGSDRRIDRARPRVEITLTPYAPGRTRSHHVQPEMEF